MTPNQWQTLEALNNCTAPWDAKHPSNRNVLAALGRLGLAEKQLGYPVGWVITAAGRRALQERQP